MKLLSNQNVALCACLKILNIISLSVINMKASWAAREAWISYWKVILRCHPLCQLIKSRTYKETESGILLSLLLEVQSNLFGVGQKWCRNGTDHQQLLTGYSGLACMVCREPSSSFYNNLLTNREMLILVWIINTECKILRRILANAVTPSEHEGYCKTNTSVSLNIVWKLWVTSQWELSTFMIST